VLLVLLPVWPLLVEAVESGSVRAEVLPLGVVDEVELLVLGYPELVLPVAEVLPLVLPVPEVLALDGLELVLLPLMLPVPLAAEPVAECSMPELLALAPDSLQLPVMRTSWPTCAERSCEVCSITPSLYLLL
jgi:hypothetical protein